MNIEQAKAVPISLILDNLNIKPQRIAGKDYYYLSPIRNEKTASFHLNTATNEWYDHGLGIGGDIIKFAQKRLEYLKADCTVSDALRYIASMSGHGRIKIPSVIRQQPEPEGEKNLVIKELQAIKDDGLIDYLGDRAIPILLAQKYLREAVIYNRKSRRHFVALAFPSGEDGGYELRNRYFKGCIGKKDITVIRGKQDKPDGFHVFEGWPDFLSAVADAEGWQFDEDTYVLNSLSLLDRPTPYIKGYGYRTAFTWLDNDAAGNAAQKSLAEFFKAEDALIHYPMNEFYLPHKDVNDWRVHRVVQVKKEPQ
ncbi:MAG TPA: CHC2 zinc finger domain-containing protein [Puia sp.]|jgi:hypothetical protein|nr:CHC2 zinc finger domain-containing protein [Puia sp.]